MPDFVYASWVLAEPFAYPLALAAVAVGTVALARPTTRLQLAFLALAGLATFARVQFVVLPLCFLAAVVLVGLRERRFRATLREQALVLAAVALPALAFLVVGPGRALGFYEGILDLDIASPEMAKWIGLDAMLLGYSAGVVLAPGAALGLWLALRRPRSREELAFGALTLPFLLALLVEAAAYGLGDDRIQERYFFYAVPLVGILFGLYASRGWPHRLAHGVLAAGVVLLAARIPLSGYSAADRKTNAPTLFATTRLEQALGDVATASLVLALGATLLLAVLVLASRRPRVATPVGLGLALAVCAATYAGAVSFNLANAERTSADVLGVQPSFVDATGIEGTAMLLTKSSERGAASEYLFWNRSVEAVYLLPGAGPPDSFAVTRLTIAPDGTLLADRRPVTRSLAAEAFNDTIRFRDADELASSPVFRLVASPGHAAALALRSRSLRERLARPGRQLPALAGDGFGRPRRDAGLRADRPERRPRRRGGVRASRGAGRGSHRPSRNPPASCLPRLRRRPLDHGVRRALDRRPRWPLRQRSVLGAGLPTRPGRLLLSSRRA